METKRRYDMAADHDAISPFLDRGFYGELSCNTGISFERNENLELQYRGVDVIVDGKHGTSYIDEKVKLNNINDPPENICFELSSVQNGKFREGWFLRENSLTTHYLIGCVFSRNTDKRTLRLEQIDNITATLVKKDDVWAFLAANGVTRETLVTLAKTHSTMSSVTNGVGGRIQRISVGKTERVWATCSHWLSENPLNLIVPFSVLNLLPHTKRYVIGRSGYTEVGYPTCDDILSARIINLEGRMAEMEERLSQMSDSDVDKVI